ncbi:zf-HC2 domain-containing protein [Streptomyces sp. NBC_00083]|uniref:zf-HC2 domain-containing protein n=1 Tax=Streptomyces sp. NBC_00083 TaxID=2975647 RepID=UPI002251AAE2|nr:zf-HC2 domain-containing protein [Streptomyces sp. NBC_00083]MCX5386897.1 zf-HC2 domain-containing protein [Streptomyces sp. NBC_00083]
MSSPQIHQDAGAYALGVLGAADAFRYEEHLVGCVPCRALLAEFGGVTALLAAYVARGGVPAGPVEPELLHRMTALVAGRRRRGRAVRIALVAAAAALAAGGVGAVLEPAAPQWRTASHAPGVTATVLTGAHGWGTDVELALAGAAPGTCTLVAVGRDGARQTVATWAERGVPVRLRGAAALPQDAIARFEVRTANGTRLAALTPG